MQEKIIIKTQSQQATQMQPSAFVFLILAAGCAIVFGCSTTSVPVQSVTASAAQEGNPASQAVDFDPYTRWSAQGSGAYITLDLGSSIQVCGVSANWYQGHTRVNFFKISASLDGTTFKQIFSGYSTHSLNLEAYPIAVTTARYIRLTFVNNTVNDWASINEIRIYSGFSHPGVLLNQGQIDFVRAKIAANQQPWKGMLSKLLANSRGKLTYTAAPVSVMTCGQEKPVATDIGCTRSRQDALAAWTLSLIWAYTGNQSYANAAKNILNAWSSTLTALPFDPSIPSTRNGLLQGAWIGEMFTRSAELLKHTNSSWAPVDVVRFQNMLTNIIGKTIYNGFPRSNGNWDASVADALISIGVFADNRTIFDQGVRIWRQRLPLYFYITSDGSSPRLLPDMAINPYWNQTVFDSRVNGLCQETCRDFGHTQMGLAAMIQSAETAYHQGLDLYSEARERFLPAFEFHSHYLNLKSYNVDLYLCLGKIRDVELKPAWEIGYNHFVNRLGLSLPQTTTLINQFRVSGPFYNDLNMAWDTLTHAGTGNVGFP